MLVVSKICHKVQHWSQGGYIGLFLFLPEGAALSTTGAAVLDHTCMAATYVGQLPGQGVCELSIGVLEGSGIFLG